MNGFDDFLATKNIDSKTGLGDGMIDDVYYSVNKMLDLYAKLEKRRIKLVSLQDNLDISTAVGRFTMQILASFAEYNHNFILEG